MKLNGWKRLGVVLSVLWLPVTLIFDPFEIATSRISGWGIVIIILLQILAFWLSAYAAVFAFRWVRKGFVNDQEPGSKG